MHSSYPFFLNPSKGDRLIVPSGCNTSAPELHLRPAVAKSLSTLDAFPGSAHPTPLAKINVSPPTTSHHPPDDFRHVCVFSYLFVLYCHFVFYNELVLLIQFCHLCFVFFASAASVCILCFSLDCVSFHIPVLPFSPAFPLFPGTSRFVPHFPSRIPVELPAPSPSSSVLSRIPLPFPPIYFLSLLHFLIPYFPLFPYFLFCFALPLPKFC